MNFEMTNEKKVELCDILDNLNDNEKMSLLDEYSARDKMDVPSYIVMEEIDEYLADWTPSQIILSLARTMRTKMTIELSLSPKS